MEPSVYSVTIDPGLKPDQKLCSAERHVKIHEKEFCLCSVQWYIVSVWTLRLLILISWLCLSRVGTRLAFSLGYNYTATLSPRKQYILCPFRHASVRQLLSLRRVEAVKLAQAGFGDFVADIHVSWLKGKCGDNKEVYFVDTISNSAGHK